MVKKTLVLGVSLNPDRYSNMAVKRLASNQVEVVAIGLKSGKINEIQIQKESTFHKNIHTVTLYLNKNRQSDYYDFIISLKPTISFLL